MITRIVRLSFAPENVKSFQKIFDDSKQKIRAMPGCRYLSLHRDHHDPAIFYTLSHWESQGHLDTYRRSELFKTTWKQTKALFNNRPQAFSLEELIVLK